jgi:hypothetical protein
MFLNVGHRSVYAGTPKFRAVYTGIPKSFHFACAVCRVFTTTEGLPTDFRVCMWRGRDKWQLSGVISMDRFTLGH